MNRLFGSAARLAAISAPILMVCTLATALRAQPTLKITSPANGMVVSPGETFIVTVDASPAAAFEGVMVGVEHSDIQSRFAPPYEFSVKIPSNTPSRRYGVIAVGAIRQGDPAYKGEPIYSDPVEIVVEPASGPQSLRIEPSLLDLRAGDPGILQAIATYPDGSTIYVSQSTKITYSSNSPDVATVTGDGRVTTVGPGLAKITVRYRDRTVVVPVTVRKRPAAPQQ
jgi:hypothetical protein